MKASLALSFFQPPIARRNYAAFDLNIHITDTDFALACWIWFPVGLAVRQSVNSWDDAVFLERQRPVGKVFSA